MLNYAKAIGANTDVVTAQAFTFLKEQKDDELLVVLIAGVGEDSFTTIRKLGLDSPDLFWENFQSVGQSFETLVQNLKAELATLEQFNALIGFFEKGTLYIETINNFSCLLLRQSHTIELTRGLDDQKLISGILEDKDRILFLSPPLIEIEKSRDSLESNLIRSQLENLEDEIEAFLQPNPGSPTADPIATVLVENTIPKPINEEDESFENQSERIEPITPPIHLYGARSKTPALFLIFLGLLRKIPFRPTSKKPLIILVIVAGFAILIGFNLLTNKLKKDSQFNLKFTQAQQSYDKAITTKDLDPNQSKILLTDAKSNLKQAELIQTNSKSKELEQKINEGSFLIFKQFEQKDFPVFLDLNLIKDNFSASRLSMSTGKIAVLDNNSKSLIAIDIAQKNPQILAGPLQLGDIQFISLNGDYIYGFSKDKGILKIDVGNGKNLNQIQPDSEWQRVVDIYGFANNVYLLDEFKNQIWKYIAADKGFSDRSQYLNVGEQTDFAAARNLQIDGAVWILKSDNTILKFIQGAKDFFQLGTIDPSLDKIKSFYTADDTDNLYFLDNDNSRVVVTNKKGEYQSEYSGDKFKTASDLVVDEKGKKLYLLGEGKIYQIDLK